MKYPQKVTDLLEQLDEELDGFVPKTSAAQLVIVINDETELSFDGHHCAKLLSSGETVKRLFDALGQPEDAILEVYDMPHWGCDVNDAIDQLFGGVANTQ